MKRIFSYFLFVLAVSTVLFSLGCQSNTPNSPLPNSKTFRANDQLIFLTSQKGSLAKNIVTTKFINAEEGGTILVGNEESGYSSIHFMPGDLNEDALITFSWNTNRHIAELLPHGLIFNNPVALNLSYQNANCEELSENNIRIWYFNEDENAWELIGGDVNPVERRVEGFIGHFSKYALGGGE